LDDDPDPTIGSYGGSGAPYGFRVTLGNYVFETSPPHLGLMVYDDSPSDEYIPDGDPLSGTGPTTILDGYFDMYLTDSTGTVFSSDALPTSAHQVDPRVIPWTNTSLSLSARDASGWLTVEGDITEVPEPEGWLLGLTALLLVAGFRRIHA
jgi:hypothetical protein